METQTNYRVSLRPQSWGSRSQSWTCNETGDTLHQGADLEAAKAAFRAEWEKREAHASAHGGPIELELMVVTTDEDGDEAVESYAGEGNPSGDTDWCSLYTGDDRDGWYVLWANRLGNGYEKPYDQNCFGTIGYHQKQYFSTGEWALRHCDDKAGAKYAEALFKTAEELAAYFYAEVDDRYHTQERLAALAGLFVSPYNHTSTLAEIDATYERVGDELWASAALPDGTTWEEMDVDGSVEYELRYAFDKQGVLYAIKCGEIPEELNNTATTGL